MMNSFSSDETPEGMFNQLRTMAECCDTKEIRIQAAREIVRRTRPDKAIPDVYMHYRPLVRDGIEVFLSKISLPRLAEIIVKQLKMSSDTSIEEHLLHLALQFPTLHKLGQLIARNRNIDPNVKTWLTQLENGNYGTSSDKVVHQLKEQIHQTYGRLPIRIRSQILSEASVGAVIPYVTLPPDSSNQYDGVFKILKPSITTHLDEELTILEEVADYFEKNRHRYAVKNLQFNNILKEVRNSLRKEIDLCAEQEYLLAAKDFFTEMPEIYIPKLAPFSSNTMTAMEYINGSKITDADLSAEQRSQCAKILTEALILKPIFSRHEQALFHGDPHAGNIFVRRGKRLNTIQVVLLDWSLAGYLKKSQRILVVRLLQGIIKNNHGDIALSLGDLMSSSSSNTLLKREELLHIVDNLVSSKAYTDATLLKRSFWLLEMISYEGAVYPSELLVYRKAFFTLEGVLYDLAPDFDLDSFTFNYLNDLLVKEIPFRCSSLYFPFLDRPENYCSLLTNMDLQGIMMNCYTSIMTGSALDFSTMYAKQLQSMGWSILPRNDTYTIK